MIPRTLNHALLNEQLKPATLTEYLKRLPHDHPERVYYRTAANRPKTVAELQACVR
ncbi:hypothetical protein GCM10027048_28020 [Hymenobacter coalescens]